MIVDTEKVLREADGPEESDFHESLPRVERCSPLSAPQRTDGRAGEEPEEHKRDEKTAHIQARSFMARAMEVNEKERKAEGKAKVV